MQKLRAIVIGSPGSGKSTFSRRLCDLTGVPLYYLDILYWNADKTNVSKFVFRLRLSRILMKSAWIIDGNYASTLSLRLLRCNTVFFLDYPENVCIDGALSRIGQKREDMPWVEQQRDETFLQYIRDFHINTRPHLIKKLSRQQHKSIIIFTSREQADNYLCRHSKQGE